MVVALARGRGRPPTFAHRPSCPQHPGSRVQLDGYFRPTWTEHHRRPRYRCITATGSRGHVFSLPVSVRQPTEDHPDGGAACVHCEHLYERHEGLKTGRHFVFAHQEIARLLLRVGELTSLRGASKQLRDELERRNRRDPSKPAFKHIGPGQTSKQANLAVNWIDAYAPVITEALLPRKWPRIVAVDSTTLTTTGYRPLTDRELERQPDPGEPGWLDGERRTRKLKAGTIMFAVDHTGPEGVPFLIQVQGGKDTESWRRFFASRSGAPDWVIADLDDAIARAVRETWPNAVLFHSGHHIRQLMRLNAQADGIPERVKLAQPIPVKRPGTGGWSYSGRGFRKYGLHPLMEAIERSLRGKAKWDELLAAIEEYIPPDKLALRSWIATNQLLIERQRDILDARPDMPRSTGSLEGKMSSTLEPLKRRAGRWQNVRRLNLVLGLVTIRARGDAREARYAKRIRDHFVARHNQSHLPSENGLGPDPRTGQPMSWWRNFHDRGEASLPKLVRESNERMAKADRDGNRLRRRDRLASIYTEVAEAAAKKGRTAPERGRPKRPDNWIVVGSTKGMKVADIPELLDEWHWDFNGDLDPYALPASSKKWAAWQCALNPDHTWSARISSRSLDRRFCPYHMRVKVHPTESVAALYPALAREWAAHPKGLRPDQVSLGSGERVTWRCELFGHDWTAPIYTRTRGDGCPECFRLEQSKRTKAGVKRSRKKIDELERAKVAAIAELERELSPYEAGLADYEMTFPVPGDEDF